MVMSVTPTWAKASTMAEVKVGMEPTCGLSATPFPSGVRNVPVVLFRDSPEGRKWIAESEQQTGEVG